DRVVVLDAGAVIADGTVGELRHRIGGQVLDVVADATGLDAVADALGSVGGEARVDQNRRHITTTTTGGLPSAVAAGQVLIDADIEPEYFALRSPSLEEAFLALTDRHADALDDGVPLDTAALPPRTRPVISRSVLRNV